MTIRQAFPLCEQGHHHQHMRLTKCWVSIFCPSYGGSIQLLQLLAGILQLHRVFLMLQRYGIDQGTGSHSSTEVIRLLKLEATSHSTHKGMLDHRRPKGAYWSSTQKHGCVADTGVLHAAAAELQPLVLTAAGRSHA